MSYIYYLKRCTDAERHTHAQRDRYNKLSFFTQYKYQLKMNKEAALFI
jgi:hypothetical protein